MLFINIEGLYVKKNSFTSIKVLCTTTALVGINIIIILFFAKFCNSNCILFLYYIIFNIVTYLVFTFHNYILLK